MTALPKKDFFYYVVIMYIMNDEIEVPHGGDTLALLLLLIV